MATIWSTNSSNWTLSHQFCTLASRILRKMVAFICFYAFSISFFAKICLEIVFSIFGKNNFLSSRTFFDTPVLKALKRWHVRDLNSGKSRHRQRRCPLYYLKARHANIGFIIWTAKRPLMSVNSDTGHLFESRHLCPPDQHFQQTDSFNIERFLYKWM